MKKLWALAKIYTASYRMYLLGMLAIIILLPVLMALVLALILEQRDPQSVYRIVAGSLMLPSLALGIGNLASVLVTIRRNDADWLVALPITPITWTVGFLIPQALLGVISGLTVALVLGLVFHLPLLPSPFLVLYLLLLPLSVAWIAAVLVRLLKHNDALAGALAQVLTLILLLGSPVYYPVERLPELLQPIMVWLPTSLAAEGIRFNMQQPLAFHPSLALLSLFALASLVVTGRVLPWSKS